MSRKRAELWHDGGNTGYWAPEWIQRYDYRDSWMARSRNYDTALLLREWRQHADGKDEDAWMDMAAYGQAVSARSRQRFNRSQQLAGYNELRALRAKASETAKDRNVRFLEYAGAIALHPVYYALWVKDYLEAGGVVRRSNEPYPFRRGVDTPYTETAYWLATNSDMTADAMPAGFGTNALHVFMDGTQHTFLRQFFTAVSSPGGSHMPADARRNHNQGPFFGAGEAQAYGESAIYAPATVEYDHHRKPVARRLAYTSRPEGVVLHQNLIGMVALLVRDDPRALQQLDMITTNGSNAARTLVP